MNWFKKTRLYKPLSDKFYFHTLGGVKLKITPTKKEKGIVISAFTFYICV